MDKFTKARKEAIYDAIESMDESEFVKLWNAYCSKIKDSKRRIRKSASRNYDYYMLNDEGKIQIEYLEDVFTDDEVEELINAIIKDYKLIIKSKIDDAMLEVIGDNFSMFISDANDQEFYDWEDTYTYKDLVTRDWSELVKEIKKK